jgi:orotidine-5'-phosphate decarboxylase
MNAKCGLLVNSSRAIIYASSEKDFAKDAGRAAHAVQEQMNRYLDACL